MFLRKLFKKNFKYTELKEKPKKPKRKCWICKHEFSKLNYAVKKRDKLYIFCSESCYYNWLREKAGLEPY